MLRNAHVQVGAGALAAAAFLWFVAIPYGVSAPSNIANIVLSPLFWPRILAGLLALAGVGLIVAGLRLPPADGADAETLAAVPRGRPRLLAMAVLMAAYVWIAPWLGLVWSSMLAFAATAFVMKTRHPRIAVAAAVAAPLVLYAFFAHVAGVAVPQGELVRLP